MGFFSQTMNRIVDEVTIFVKAGNGGKGCESRQYLNERKFIMTGGEGGRGGSVIIRSDANVTTLRDFLYHRHFAAENGGPGGSNHKRGKNAKNLVISVPCGTVVYRKEKRFLIRDLVQPGEEVVVVEGGRGGVGNEGKKQAEPGEKGVGLEITLLWKILADVFLVGLPSAGKSKLLNRLTRAHAKEDTYPFTTKHPELGIYETPDFEQVRICELPGIYRESFEGRGAGVDFLKHLDRARLILLMLDPLNAFAPTLQEGYGLLVELMGRFQKSLLEIPHAAAVNKMDLAEVRERFNQEGFRPPVPLFLISAQTGEGVEPLMRYVVQKIQEPFHV